MVRNLHCHKGVISHKEFFKLFDISIEGIKYRVYNYLALTER